MIRLPFGVLALLFDLDNTLFDRDRAFQAWAQAFVQRQLGSEDAAAQRSAIEQLITLDDHGHGEKATMFTSLKEMHPVVHTPVSELVTTFREEMPTYCTLDEEAAGLLQVLHQEALSFGIVTNGSSYQLRRISALGLHLLTTCIFVSELVGYRKPDAEIFLAAATCLSVAPERILFVGDTPEADIVGAHRVGMRTAWLRRPGRAWPRHLAATACDLTITTLAELHHL